MEEFDDKMEMMSEETARGLIEVFEEFNKCLADAEEICKKFDKIIYQELVQEVTKRFFDYVEKYSSATFVTRWYWKRKAIKMAQAVKEANGLLKKHYGITEH